MSKEREQSELDSLDSLKAQVFASAFGSFDPQTALGEYHKIFEGEKEKAEKADYEVEEFQPESKEDVLAMLNAAKRAGVIT